MIGMLLPREITVVEAHDGRLDLPLHVLEAASIMGASDKRRDEYTAGRSCARRALSALNITDFPLLSGPKREPIWPAGIAGSITHCTGYCAAAVARTSMVKSLGIDAELDKPLGRDIERMVCTSGELEWCRTTSITSAVNWPVIVFSAKESIYKACFPIVKEYIDFQDAELAIDPAAGIFHATFLNRQVDTRIGHAGSLDGRFAVGNGYIFTAIWFGPD
jgi:enterobactin synthetase component D / holo-[acyl-carrier protein] synthase